MQFILIIKNIIYLIIEKLFNYFQIAKISKYKKVILIFKNIK